VARQLARQPEQKKQNPGDGLRIHNKILISPTKRLKNKLRNRDTARGTTMSKNDKQNQNAAEQNHPMLDKLPTPVLLINTQGQVIYANQYAQERLGLFAGSDIIKYFEQPEQYHQALEEINKQGFLENLEINAIADDGARLFISLSARAMEHEGQTVFLASIHKDTKQKLARQAARIHALYRIQQAIVSSLDLEQVLQILVAEVVEQLQVDAVAVLLVNQDTNTLDFAASHGFRNTDALKYTRLRLGVGLAGRAAQERKIVHSANLKESPILIKSLENEDFVAYYGIPLIATDKLHGVLEILHRSSLTPDPEWLSFLDLLSDQAALSIDNARLLQLTQQNLKETNALYRINQDLLATIDPYELMTNVVELLKSSFGYYHAQIYVAEPGTGNFVVRAASGELGKKVLKDGYRLAVGEGIVGFTAETGKPFFTNDVENSISFVRSPHLPKTASQLAVPIKIGPDFLGLIDIQQDKSFPLTERDLQLVSAIADQLALALQKATLYSDLQDALSQEKAMRAQLIQTEKLTVAGRLLASVSHELNNPIQAIQNALFLLKEEQGISPQGRQDLEIVLSETERMATLLQRLRATYQPLDPSDFKPIQINELIEDICALLGAHLRQRQIAFEFHAYPELPPVSGIEDQIRQVVLNLFLNATDAMPQGGRLTIATQHITTRKQVLITVSDTGPGIEHTIFQNIFDAFVTSKSGGTGLGLTISNEIVQKHRGQIKAANNSEQGATFEVWLPVEQEMEE
jgi:signal transduction histidine kinase